MLNDTEVKRIIEAINEYRELVQQSTEMRDQLESLQKRWFSLRQEREGLRTSVDSLHTTLAQVKADYQAVMKRMTDLYATEETVLDNIKFLIDELTSVLKKHEGYQPWSYPVSGPSSHRRRSQRSASRPKGRRTVSETSPTWGRTCRRRSSRR